MRGEMISSINNGNNNNNNNNNNNVVTKKEYRTKHFSNKIAYRKPVRFPKAMYKKKFYRDLKFLELKKHCYIYIKQTLNNMFITVKHTKGKLILSKSVGTAGFKGPKKSSNYAATQLAKNVRNYIKNKKKTATLVLLSKITGNIKGAIKNISNRYSLKILDIIERIPIPHNGLRKPSIRRK